MHTATGSEKGAPRFIVLAIVLFLGVLLVTYGYSQQDRLFLFGGLSVIGGGVLFGLLRLIMR